MKNMKRYFSMFVTLAMSVSILPINAQAETSVNQGTQLNAVEVEGNFSLDSLETKANEPLVTSYKNDDIVTVIVELEDDPVLDYYSANSGTRTISAGESVSDFLVSKEAANISEDLANDQEKVISKIKKLFNNNETLAKASADFEVVDSWTTIANAIAVKVPYKMIKEIKNLKGVKRAYIEHVYDRPEPIENSIVEEGKPTFSYSYDMVGIDETWNEGYTGKGMLVAVLDTGLDIKTNADGDLSVLPTSSNHGTHVSGTVAGYVETEEGEVKFVGVAPDAQILSMKVFPDVDGGAQEGVLINALEDSLILGADIINLSLGSDNGFSDDDTMANEVYQRVNSAGIVMITSAGNSDKSSDNNNYNGSSLAANPDEAMTSAPAVYSSNLSVASIDNTINVQSYLTWNDDAGNIHEVPFKAPSASLIKEDFSDNEYPIYAVGGVGSYNDYYEAGFNNGYNNGKTGFALVKRGEI